VLGANQTHWEPGPNAYLSSAPTSQWQSSSSTRRLQAPLITLKDHEAAAPDDIRLISEIDAGSAEALAELYDPASAIAQCRSQSRWVGNPPALARPNEWAYIRTIETTRALAPHSGASSSTRAIVESGIGCPSVASRMRAKRRLLGGDSLTARGRGTADGGTLRLRLFGESFNRPGGSQPPRALTRRAPRSSIHRRSRASPRRLSASVESRRRSGTLHGDRRGRRRLAHVFISLLADAPSGGLGRRCWSISPRPCADGWEKSAAACPRARRIRRRRRRRSQRWPESAKVDCDGLAGQLSRGAPWGSGWVVLNVDPNGEDRIRFRTRRSVYLRDSGTTSASSAGSTLVPCAEPSLTHYRFSQPASF
jgi:hypothetical protein